VGEVERLDVGGGADGRARLAVRKSRRGAREVGTDRGSS
jgi:hypothetical protein